MKTRYIIVNPSHIEDHPGTIERYDGKMNKHIKRRLMAGINKAKRRNNGCN